MFSLRCNKTWRTSWVTSLTPSQKWMSISGQICQSHSSAATVFPGRVRKRCQLGVKFADSGQNGCQRRQSAVCEGKNGQQKARWEARSGGTLPTSDEVEMGES